MAKKTLAARLRDAERRNAALQKQVTELTGFVNHATGDYSGASIVSSLALDDVTKTAINTARRLGYAVTIAPDQSDRGKFYLRAHRKPD